MEDTKKSQFHRALREVKNLPTLPGIIAKLTRMAEDPDTTTEQMGKVISKDHILAAKLLKLVNSAFYGFPQKISSLNSAIILLGFNVIKSLRDKAKNNYSKIEQNMFIIWHDLRDLENTKLPFIMFSYYKKGGAAYEDIDFGSKWSIARTGGLDFAFG
jgi:hypothetical protein